MTVGVGVVVSDVEGRTGLRLDPSRAREVVSAHMSARGVGDIGVYRGLIARDTDAYQELIAELTIDESYFFRHPDQLSLIVRMGLLAPPGRAAGRPLTIWSAGCATGEEPYTLAMLLEDQGVDRARLVATDVSTAALDHARTATYRRWSFRSQHALRRRHRFQVTADGRYRLDPEIASKVEFRTHNLLTDPSPEVDGDGFDVIVCRNVLLHMGFDAAAAVARRLVLALAPGGHLVTGPGDPPPVGIGGLGVAGLVPVVTEQGILYRKAPSGEVDRPTGEHSPPRTRSMQRHAEPRSGSHRSTPTPGRLPSDRNTDPAAPDVERLLDAATDALDVGDHERALQAARAAAFLAPDAIVAHLVLAMSAHATGQAATSRRAYRSAAELLASLPPEAEVPGSGGEPAGRLLGLATAHLAAIHDGGSAA